MTYRVLSDDFSELVARAADPTATPDDLRDLLEEVNYPLTTDRKVRRFVAVSQAALANPNIDPVFGYEFFLSYTATLAQTQGHLTTLLRAFFGNAAMPFWMLSGEAREAAETLRDVSLLLLRELPLGTKPMNFEGVGQEFYRQSLDEFFAAVGKPWENEEWMNDLVMMLDSPFYTDDRWPRWKSVEDLMYEQAHHDARQYLGATSSLFVLRYLWQHIGFEGDKDHRSWPEVFAFFRSLSSFQPSPSLLTRAKVTPP